MTITNVEINENDFDYVFFDDVNIHGYQLCGISIYEFNDLYLGSKPHENVFEIIPENVKSKPNNFLIKSDNLKSFINNHILMISESDENDYYKMTEIIKNNEPEKINNENRLKFDQFDKFTEFIYNELIENSKLEINNQKFIVIDDDKFGLLQSELIEKYYNNK